MAILVDTNVLLRSVYPNHPQASVARLAVEYCRKSRQSLVIVPQNGYEFWVVSTRPGAQNGLDLTASQAGLQLQALFGVFTLLRDERLIFDHWQSLIQMHSIVGKSAHDARLAAAMKRHGISHILTLNERDFARNSGRQVLLPEDVVAGKVAF